MDVDIVGGEVWQWDLNRRVQVIGYLDGDIADFAQREGCTAVSVAVEDGYAPIPNELLREDRDLRVWIRRDGVTVCSRPIPVRRRQKPLDYIYSETPAIGYAQLEKRVEALEQGGGGGGAVQRVEEPLLLADGTLSIDAEAVRGNQVTSGDDAPTFPAKVGDVYIRSNGELYRRVQVTKR